MKTNEEIIKIIDNNVYYNQSLLVFDALGNNFFKYDDIYQTDFYEIKDLNSDELKTMNFEELQDLIIEIGENIEICKSEEDNFCQNQYAEYLDYLNHVEPEYNEIYEWWVCSNWFSEKMEKAGYSVLNNEYGTWWGRTTTGQQIWLDFQGTNIFDQEV